MDGQVIIESTRRRVWPENVKRGIIAESYDPAQIYQWRKRYPVPDWMRRSEPASDGFVAVEVAAAPGEAVSTPRAGSVLPFPSRKEPKPSDQSAALDPTGPGIPSGDFLTGDRIEAVLPDGVVLRLPGDIAAGRLVVLVDALREARP